MRAFKLGSVEESFHPKGLEICRLMYDGWVKPDGSWDVFESARAPAGMAQRYFELAKRGRHIREGGNGYAHPTEFDYYRGTD